MDDGCVCLGVLTCFAFCFKFVVVEFGVFGCFVGFEFGLCLACWLLFVIWFWLFARWLNGLLCCNVAGLGLDLC